MSMFESLRPIILQMFCSEHQTNPCNGVPPVLNWKDLEQLHQPVLNYLLDDQKLSLVSGGHLKIVLRKSKDGRL